MQQIIHILFPEASSHIGGSQLSTFDVIEHLAYTKQPIKLHYAVQSKTPSYESFIERKIPINVYILGQKGYSGFIHINWIITYMYKAWRLLINEKIDIVHCTNETLLWWLIPCWLTNAKPVWNVRSEMPVGWKAKLRQQLYLTFCKHVIFVSEAAQLSVQNIRSRKDISFRVIRNFVPLWLEELSSIKPLEPTRTLTLGFVARLNDSVKDPERAFKLAAEMLGFFPELTFRVYGASSNESQANLMRLIPAELQVRVYMLGKYPIQEIYKEIDVLLLTSRSEGSPRVIMEAALYSIPTVATNVGGVPELIKQGVTGWYFDNDEQGSQYLKRLLESESERKGMGYAARQYFLTHFSWKFIINEYLDFYRIIMKSNSN